MSITLVHPLVEELFEKKHILFGVLEKGAGGTVPKEEHGILEPQSTNQASKKRQNLS